MASIDTTTTLEIGDRVRFVLGSDIEAIIIGTAYHATGLEYHIAWLNHGERKTDWVQECEIEKAPPPVSGGTRMFQRLREDFVE